jgi:hypothetical protein
MPHKKKNLELEFGGIHNPPEQFYFKFKHITLFADDLHSMPTVTTHRVLQLSTVDKVYRWEKDNNLSKKKMFEWVDLIKPLVHIFELTPKLRKELFSIYLETQETKLKEAIEATEKAIEQIWNEDIRLPIQSNALNERLYSYKMALKTLKQKHRRTGKYKLLYDVLLPLVIKFESEDISQYRQIRLLNNLFVKFKFDDFIDKSDPHQSIRNILKELHKDKLNSVT